MFIGGRFHFNSIKVRLERSGKGRRATTREFQFHKGTIRTIKSRKGIDELVENFNSIKVRLEQPDEPYTDEKEIWDFNSIKVRLERVLFAVCSRFPVISIP